MSVAIDHAQLPAGRYVINHDTMRFTATGTVGNPHGSGRALALSEPWDIIQLHPDLESLWDDIRAHYARVGLRHTEDVIWHVYREELGEHIGYQPSVSCFGPNECHFWGDIDWMEAVEFIDSRNNLVALARRFGVDIPETRCFTRAANVDAADLQRVGFPCYLKPALPGSGNSRLCRDVAQLHDVLGAVDDDTAVQIQAALPASGFVDLQYRVVGDRLVRLTASERLFDGTKPIGNRAPARHAPWAVVEPLAEWLVERGIKGVFSFELAIVDGDRSPRFVLIGCRPRFSAASYAAAVAHKLDIPAWRVVALTTRHRDLAAIDLAGIEYRRTSGEGVILVDWGTVVEGRLLVLSAGTPARQRALLRELHRRL